MKQQIKSKVALAVLLIYLFIPAVVFAISDVENLLNEAAGSQGAGYDVNQKYAKQGPALVVAGVIRTVLGVIGVVFICYIIYAGYLWLTSAGSEEKVTKAKKILTTSVIGLAVIMFAYLITIFVFWRLAGIYIGSESEGLFGPLNF